jgi:heat shock protein HslJ
MSTPPIVPPGAARPRVRSRRRRRRLLAAGTVLVLLALGACSDPPAEPDLVGRSFESTAVDGHTLVDGTVVRLIVRSDGISVQAGCNTLFGDATWTDGVLSAPQLASTMMACDDDLMAQDQWLAAFLEGSPPYELDGDTLTLGEAGEQITLTDVTA